MLGTASRSRLAWRVRLIYTVLPSVLVAIVVVPPLLLLLLLAAVVLACLIAPVVGALIPVASLVTVALALATALVVKTSLEVAVVGSTSLLVIVEISRHRPQQTKPRGGVPQQPRASRGIPDHPEGCGGVFVVTVTTVGLEPQLGSVALVGVLAVPVSRLQSQGRHYSSWQNYCFEKMVGVKSQISVAHCYTFVAVNVWHIRQWCWHNPIFGYTVFITPNIPSHSLCQLRVH